MAYSRYSKRVSKTKQRHVIKNNKCGCRLGKVDELALIKKAKLWHEDVSGRRGKDVGIRARETEKDGLF